MKNLVEFFMPIKVFAAMAFFGLICLYVVGGILYVVTTGEAIEFAIPFVFIFQSMGLSIVVAILWSLFFNQNIAKKWRFFLRYTLFALLMLALLAICFLTFLAIPTEWVRPLLFAALAFFAGTSVFVSLNELAYKKTGERYMETLKAYKKTLPQ